MDRLAELLTGRVLDIVLPPLVTAIAALVVAVLTKQLQKIGLTVTAQQRDSMKATVKDAILAVEEEARKTPMSGAVKESRAVDIAKVEQPKASDAELRQQIKSALPEIRAQLAPPLLPMVAVPSGFGRPKTPEELANPRKA